MLKRVSLLLALLMLAPPVLFGQPGGVCAGCDSAHAPDGRAVRGAAGELDEPGCRDSPGRVSVSAAHGVAARPAGPAAPENALALFGSARPVALPAPPEAGGVVRPAAPGRARPSRPLTTPLLL